MYEAAYGGDATQSTDPEVCSSALFGNDPVRDLSNNMFRHTSWRG
jgi:hypothetical protein